MIKAIVFDLDGTIIDTLYSIAYSLNSALVNHGYMPSETKEYISYIGDGIDELVLRAMHLKEKNEDFFKIKEEYQDNYLKYQISLATKFEGMEETLIYLKNKGYKLACISNKPDLNVKEMVSSFYPGLFEYVAGQKASVKKKPNKEALEIMAQYFGLTKEEIAYVGDSHVDYNFANNYGCTLFLATYGYEKEEIMKNLKPAIFIDKPLDLETYF